MIQDGPAPFEAEVREVKDEERSQWWDRAVAAYPDMLHTNSAPSASFRLRPAAQIVAMA